MSDKAKAIILLSGGLDSTTVLAIAKSQGYELYGLTFRYGQRHHFEVESAKRIAKSMNVLRHIIIDIDMRKFGGSALTDNIEVPKNRDVEHSANDIPITYVPARNTIFLSYALAFAEVVETGDIHIGVNALDYSGYPDCRPEFIQAFERMANLGTRSGAEGKIQFKIHAPLIQKTKAEIIKTGLELGVDYSLTNSCYDPSTDGIACGKCDSCKLRLKGFAEAGMKDPLRYQIDLRSRREVE